MLNLTIAVLSLSSLYSSSPMFTGNRYHLQHSIFNSFISPFMFFKQEQLELNRNFFKNGIGSLIYYNGDINEYYKNIYLNNNTKTQITTNNTKHLFVISDCIFDQIQEFDQKNNFIKVEGNVTFYITSCTFNSCNFASSVLNIQSRANTISHICCYGLYYGLDNGLGVLFLDASPQVDSFIKIYYSSIIGNSNLQGKNEKVDYLMKIEKTVSTKCQCMNISNFNLKNQNKGDTNPSYGIIKFTSPKCLNMVMSTFLKLTSEAILLINPHDGKIGFKHYIGMCNFEENVCGNSFIFFDMQDGTRICIDNCIFKNPNNSVRYLKAHPNVKAFVHIENCVFDASEFLNSILNYTIIDCTSNEPNPQTHILAHYIVDGVCHGVKNETAYGCKNESCPDNMGCNPDAFKFKPEDVPYTEMHHPDVDTPTPSPTVAFTESSEFSYSSSFSGSNDFTESGKFTRSKPFSETSGFTETYMFSKTEYFTHSDSFTTSNAFSESDNFTNSMYFTYSSYFSGTGEFTKTGYFSQTTNFTISNDFTKSTMFSESNDFTNSMYFTYSSYFSGTDEFTKTGYFSQTTSFTISNDFTKSKMFSESNDFTNSMQFTFSSYFSETSKFTKTTGFTQTGHFSMTTDFTKSNDFTRSANFEPTEDFNHTHKFTPSSIFSQSTEFTKSDFFSLSKDFTKSSDFDPTKAFTQSSRFTSSSVFTQSGDFHPTNTFSPSEKFSRSSYFTKTDGFTYTGDFSQSGHFSESEFFTKSDEFTKSNVFSSSKTFKPKAPVVIDIKSDETHGMTMGTKIGIGVAAGAVATALAVVGIIFLRRRRAMYKQFDDEGIEIRPLTESSVISQNPLMNLMSDDDPFEDEFN